MFDSNGGDIVNGGSSDGWEGFGVGVGVLLVGT